MYDHGMATRRNSATVTADRLTDCWKSADWIMLTMSEQNALMLLRDALYDIGRGKR